MENKIKDPFFSIIIPVYNVQEYLLQCVNSILCQSFTNYEIILVDDGSPDKSPQICDKLASENETIIVIHHQVNKGLSAARNTGIHASKGKWLMFVDSDDYWDSSTALEDVYQQLCNRKVDLLLFGVKDLDCRTGKIIISRFGYDLNILHKETKNNIISYLMKSNLFPGSAWITVTNESFIKENKLFFLNGYKSEDIDWILNVFIHARSFSAVNKAFYVYRKYRDSSITGRVNEKTVKDLIFIINKWNNNFKYIDDPCVNDLTRYLAYCYLIVLINYSRLNKIDKQSVEKQVLNLSGILYKSSFLHMIIGFILGIIGINFGSLVLRKTYVLLHH